MAVLKLTDTQNKAVKLCAKYKEVHDYSVGRGAEMHKTFVTGRTALPLVDKGVFEIVGRRTHFAGSSIAYAVYHLTEAGRQYAIERGWLTVEQPAASIVEIIGYGDIVVTDTGEDAKVIAVNGDTANIEYVDGVYDSVKVDSLRVVKRLGETETVSGDAVKEEYVPQVGDVVWSEKDKYLGRVVSIIRPYANTFARLLFEGWQVGYHDEDGNMYSVSRDVRFLKPAANRLVNRPTLGDTLTCEHGIMRAYCAKCTPESRVNGGDMVVHRKTNWVGKIVDLNSELDMYFVDFGGDKPEQMTRAEFKPVKVGAVIRQPYAETILEGVKTGRLELDPNREVRWTDSAELVLNHIRGLNEFSQEADFGYGYNAALKKVFAIIDTYRNEAKKVKGQ